MGTHSNPHKEVVGMWYVYVDKKKFCTIDVSSLLREIPLSLRLVTGQGSYRDEVRHNKVVVKKPLF